jgi:hypothetical protein
MAALAPPAKELGRMLPACCMPRLRARPTAILPPPIRAATPSPHPSDKSRARTAREHPHHSSRTQSHYRWPRAIRTHEDTVGKPAAESLQQQLPHRLAPPPISKRRIVPAATRVHPPTNLSTAVTRSRGRRAPIPPRPPPGARNLLGQSSPMPWAAYNRVRPHPCQNESGASLCF